MAPSKCCPLPVFSRCSKAAIMAIVAWCPAKMSPTEEPTRHGGPPSGPVMLIKPLYPWATMS
jgi:hypothetical protein